MKRRLNYAAVLVAVMAIVAVVVVAGPLAAQSEPSTISNVLTANVGAVPDETSVGLTWALGTTPGVMPANGSFTSDPLDLTLTVNTPQYLWVNAKSNVVGDIDRVLFLVESQDVFEIYATGATGGEPGWSGVLPYDAGYGSYYYGPAIGFTMTAGWDEYTEFRVTPESVGSYTAYVYTVQLP